MRVGESRVGANGGFGAGLRLVEAVGRAPARARKS